MQSTLYLQSKPNFPKGELALEKYKLGFLSYENGCSPRPNRTPKGVRSLVLLHAETRHESEGGQASPHSHTWLPYITPNGVRLAREILILLK